MKTGIESIAAERERQKSEEGWTAEHDDKHDEGQLALAAVCYATPKLLYGKYDGTGCFIMGDPWPFEPEWDKRYHYGECGDGGKHEGANFPPDPGSYSNTERIDLLVKAGALIAAEIDRLQRLESERKAL